MGKSFLFMSGKGGVGKSTLAAAIAVTAAEQGRRVALIDGDIGLRSLDMMLGLQDKVLFDLSDVTSRRCPLDSALVWHPQFPTLRLLVGGQEAKPKDFKQGDLVKIISTLKKRFDWVLVDGPAGLGRGVRNFSGIVDEVVIVATADPVSQRSAEKTASLLYPQGIRPSLLLNRVDKAQVLDGVIPQPKSLSQALELSLLGVVEESPLVYRYMLQGKTAAETEDPALKEAFRDIIQRMDGIQKPLPEYVPERLGLFRRIWKWLED